MSIFADPEHGITAIERCRLQYRKVRAVPLGLGQVSRRTAEVSGTGNHQSGR